MEVNKQFSAKAKHDFKLIQAAVEDNDEKAYAELMSIYKKPVYHVVLKMVRNPDDAEDLTIEAFAKAFRNLHKFNPEYAFSTWLFRIARNRRIDLVRRDRSDRLDPADPLLIPSDPPAPDATVEAEDRERIVHAALESLPSEQVELVRMAFFLGRSHAEIAEATGLPLGTVKSRIRLAFGKLKKLLDES